jgi:hypothetical protein
MPDAWAELGKAIVEVFKTQPGVLALMIVVGLLFLLLWKKEVILQEFVKGQKIDAERAARMLTLLEVIVNRKNGGTP